jgi:quercetin dioxygenase-like cupin family protein
MSDHQGNPRLMAVLPLGATTKGAGDRFGGDVWADTITAGVGVGCARLVKVRFAPGARTAWHCHAHGQTLHVTSGLGLVQSRNGQPITMRPGDTVYTPAGVALARVRCPACS